MYELVKAYNWRTHPHLPLLLLPDSGSTTAAFCPETMVNKISYRAQGQGRGKSKWASSQNPFPRMDFHLNFLNYQEVDLCSQMWSKNLLEMYSPISR